MNLNRKIRNRCPPCQNLSFERQLTDLFFQEMVRVGEFSPQNPNLQTTGRSLLGLGEYEERRRQLLQKKREEYHQELAQIAQAQKLQK